MSDFHLNHRCNDMVEMFDKYFLHKSARMHQLAVTGHATKMFSPLSTSKKMKPERPNMDLNRWSWWLKAVTWSVSHLLYWEYWLKVMLPVADFVASAWSPWLLATNRAKVIYWRDANLCKEGNALAKRHKSEFCGFKSKCQKRIFLVKSMFKLACMIILLWNFYLK